MAGKIDFQGFMDLVEEDLLAWFAGEKVEDEDAPTGKKSKPPPEKPCVLRAWYTLPGVASREEIAHIPFSPEAADAGNLRSQLEHEIGHKLGVDPPGVLRVKAYEDKNQSNAGVDLTRTLAPVEGPEVIASSRLLNRLRQQHQQGEQRAYTLLQLDNGILGQAVAALTSSNATLATQRATGSTAADLGTPWAILGLGALLMSYPVGKKILADNPKIARKLEGYVSKLLDDVLEDDTPRIEPPDGDVIKQLEDKGDGANDADNGADFGELADLHKLLSDPANLAKLATAAKLKGIDIVKELGGAVPEPAG